MTVTVAALASEAIETSGKKLIGVEKFLEALNGGRLSHAMMRERNRLVHSAG